MEQAPPVAVNHPVKSPPPPIIESPEAEAQPVNRAQKTMEALIPEPSRLRAIPMNTLQLPSGGVAVIQPAGAGAEEILSSVKLQESGDAFDLWLTACIMSLNGVRNPGPGDGFTAFLGDTLNLFPGDRRQIAVEIIGFTYGDRIDCPVDCPHCGETNELAVDVKAILATSKPYPEQRAFEVVLPSGRKAVYGYNTGVHQKTLRAMGADGMSLLDGLKMRLRSLDGRQATSKSWAELDGPDRAALRAAILSHPDCGPDTSVRNVCRKCKKPFVTSLEMHLSFFLPGLRLS